jgi:hypothetical protein
MKTLQILPLVLIPALFWFSDASLASSKPKPTPTPAPIPRIKEGTIVSVSSDSITIGIPKPQKPAKPKVKTEKSKHPSPTPKPTPAPKVEMNTTTYKINAGTEVFIEHKKAAVKDLKTGMAAAVDADVVDSLTLGGLDSGPYKQANSGIQLIAHTINAHAAPSK